MPKKPTERLERARRLSAEQAARDRAIRQQVEEEFPPKHKPLPGNATDLRDVLAALKQARTKQGLTLAEVTARSGIEPPNLSKLENSPEANPTIETLQRYASAVGKRIRVLIEDAKGPAV